MKNGTLSFPATSLSKLRSCQVTPFRKIGRRLNPQQERGTGGGAHYELPPDSTTKHLGQGIQECTK